MNKKEEIKFLLQTYGIKQSWLAKKLGLTRQTLSYLLNEKTTIDDDLYERIKKIVEDYQLELDLYYENKDEENDLFAEEKLNLGVGERIRIFAKRKYSTLKGLATAMKISPQQLQQYVSGKREPGTKILVKLLKLGCDINWLLGGAESLESYRVYKLERELRKYEATVNQIKNSIKKYDL